jgi:hypothetical protein
MGSDDPGALLGLSMKEQQKMLQQQVNKTRTGAFDQTLVLAKELVSPNTEACYSNLVAPTILSLTPFVFVLESPQHITLWNSLHASFIETLEQPSEKPAMENIVVLGDYLVAFSRDRLFIWRPVRSNPSDTTSSTHHSIRASTSSLNLAGGSATAQAPAGSTTTAVETSSTAVNPPTV